MKNDNDMLNDVKLFKTLYASSKLDRSKGQTQTNNLTTDHHLSTISQMILQASTLHYEYNLDDLTFIYILLILSYAISFARLTRQIY